MVDLNTRGVLSVGMAVERRATEMGRAADGRTIVPLQHERFYDQAYDCTDQAAANSSPRHSISNQSTK